MNADEIKVYSDDDELTDFVTSSERTAQGSSSKKGEMITEGNLEYQK